MNKDTIEREDKKLTLDRQRMLKGYEASRELKSLNTTRNKLLSYAKKCKMQINQYQKDLEDTENRLKDTVEAISNIENTGYLLVSEHAILRYLSRFKGVDLEKTIEEITQLPPENLVVKGSSVVTIQEPYETNREVESE